jgi:hypothetical protein
MLLAASCILGHCCSLHPAPHMLLQDCDEAIESYTRTRSAYYNLAPPSTYRTASQRIMDIISSTLKVTVGVLGWVASVPGKLWSLRKWSRDDWSGWYAGIKKTVKDEAHHYWVSLQQPTAARQWVVRGGHGMTGAAGMLASRTQ